MPPELLPYITLLLLGGGLSSFLGIYALVKIRRAAGARHFIAASFLAAVFTFAYAAELSSDTLREIRFWAAVEYLALPFIPLFVLFLCIEYTGKKVPWRWLPLLAAAPVMTLVLNWTNPLHHLYYTSVTLREDSPFPIADFEPGPWLYVNYLYVYTCLAAAAAVLLRQFRKMQRPFRLQALTMISGISIPLVSSLFYLTGSSPYGIDLGAVSLSLTFLFIGAALFSFQMFDVVPIARDSVFESMADGVLVISEGQLVVDFNPAAAKVLPELEIGKKVEEVLSADHPLAVILDGGQDGDFSITKNGAERNFNARLSAVRNKYSRQIGRIVTLVDVTERVRIQEKMTQLASIDGLTQVLNRTFFIQETGRALGHSRRAVLILFDLDYFKNINDTYGHAAGDQVLIQTMETVKACLGPDDLLGRYGGEEFIILLPDATLEKGFARAEKIRLEIERQSIQAEGQEIRVTSSFGVAAADWTDGKAPDALELMRQADKVLYEAKENGRNCVYVFGTGSDFLRLC
ncbi:histidine kinase N-terminal 7TM domain-containing diguanylate cyclase [Indiicoccus explosivorum]|uniref:histidine kinase N-terminal 7TM domain-containing diguanylate cyclase n=1 Tax=Indiicoccus explosivorum TaxID=1917864 RepID=UPI000B43CDD9|nr:histidine kinase N-terminal 7TM domain-containing protein [Indiicoccus explosivorum]